MALTINPKTQKNQVEMNCLVKRTVKVLYDNGLTPGSSSNNVGTRPDLVRFNWTLESLGWETDKGLLGVGDTIGPYSGWGPQLTGWRDFGTTHYSDDTTHTSDFVGAPTWRAWNVTTCNPRAQLGTWTLQRLDGSGGVYKVYPVNLEVSYDYCYTKEICDNKGQVIEIKWYEAEDEDTFKLITTPSDAACYVAKDFEFPNPIFEDAVSPCTQTKHYLCDTNNDDTQVILFINNCGDQGINKVAYELDVYNNASDPEIPEYDLESSVLVTLNPVTGEKGETFVEPVKLGDGYYVENVKGCFCSTDNIKVPVLIHTAYQRVDDELTVIDTFITNAFNNDKIDESVFMGGGKVVAEECASDRAYVDTCFLPDQYAIQWSWNGSGDLTSYDPITDEWTDWGKTQVNGTIVGGYALAFKNDTVEPTLYFQRSGKLYKASPDDPVNTFSLVGPTTPVATGSYPCFDFDPSGRLVVGIISGSRVAEIDPLTGTSSILGTLTDWRDGATLQAGPGDWFFDPNGRWFLMARDVRGANFLDNDGNPYCTGTVLWEIHPSTLVTTRVSQSCSPVSGTGASWLASGRSLLSTGSGVVYEYNVYTDIWSVFSSGPRTINDLASQWIIPKPIRVFGWVDENCEDGDCNTKLFTYEQRDDSSIECKEFVPTLKGSFGVCQPSGNPFVSDPFSPTSGASGCDSCSDQVWHEGCSSAGYTRWRVSYDSAGNENIEYLYGTLTEPTNVPPNRFFKVPCGEQNSNAETTVWCNLDTNETIFRKEFNTGFVRWFGENGTIGEPVNKTPGECEQSDPLLPVTQEIVCYENGTYIRRVKETYIENSDGLAELATYEIIYFNEDGVLWESGVLNADDVPTGEPEGYYFGDCQSNYIDFRYERLCEKDDKKLLLVDSGGNFAEYSFTDKTVTDISSLSVPSAGSGADPDNFLLYAITAQNTLQTIDVNTKVLLDEVGITSSDGSPLTFSAAHFYDGKLFATTNSGGQWTVHEINVDTAVVSQFSGPWTDIAGSGTSMAINPVDGKFYITGSSGRIYEIGSTAGSSGTATFVYNSPGNIANGATFDTDGVLYLTGGPNTYQITNFGTGNEVEELIIDDWTPAANSITFYRIKAQTPSCFNRKFGVTADGSFEYISDHFVADNSERVVSGSIECCEGCSSSESTSTTDGNVNVTNDNFDVTVTNDPQLTLCDESIGYKTENVKFPITYWSLENVDDNGFRNREWENTFTTTSVTASDTEFGRNIRENHDFSAATSVDNTSNTMALNDTNNAASLADLQVLEGYIVVSDSQAGTYRYTTNSEGYFALELGQCCDPLDVIAELGKSVGINAQPEFTIPSGIHQVRIWNIDSAGSNSNWNLQKLEGSSWVNANDFFVKSGSKPSWVCQDGWICGNEYQQFDGSELSFNDLTLRCKPECTASYGQNGTSSSIICPDEVTQTIESGQNSSVPAGLKSVTINNITGSSTIDGSFRLGAGRRIDAISFDATNHSCINGVLPSINITGGTWQWIGVRD